MSDALTIDKGSSYDFGPLKSKSTSSPTAFECLAQAALSSFTSSRKGSDFEASADYCCFVKSKIQACMQRLYPRASSFNFTIKAFKELRELLLIEDNKNPALSR